MIPSSATIEYANLPNPNSSHIAASTAWISAASFGGTATRGNSRVGQDSPASSHSCVTFRRNPASASATTPASGIGMSPRAAWRRAREQRGHEQSSRQTWASWPHSLHVLAVAGFIVEHQLHILDVSISASLWRSRVGRSSRRGEVGHTASATAASKARAFSSAAAPNHTECRRESARCVSVCPRTML